MKTKTLLFWGVAMTLALPQSVFADAGTPLMWASLLHLVFGNFIIGIGEGLLLSRLFAISKRKSICLLIPANYFSAWVGGLFLNSSIVHGIPIDLNNGWIWFWVMVFFTYCMTLLLEWPFVAWCFQGRHDWWRQSVKASLSVQTASYVVLFGWYWMASVTSLYTSIRVVAPTELLLPNSVLVYFISTTDGNVYKKQLVGGASQKIYELHSADKNDRLFVRTNTTNTNTWDLIARVGEDNRNPTFITIQTNMTAEATQDWRSSHLDPPEYEGTGFNFGSVQKLGSATNSPWDCSSGFWSGQGVYASNKVTGEHYRFAYETPFAAWSARNAILLPSDKVLFQLGDDQICVFDPAGKRISLLWHGRGPVAVISLSH